MRNNHFGVDFGFFGVVEYNQSCVYLRILRAEVWQGDYSAFH